MKVNSKLLALALALPVPFVVTSAGSSGIVNGLVARPDIVRLTDSTSVLVDLIANDSDAAGRELTVVLPNAAPAGVAIANNGDGTVLVTRTSSAPDGDVTVAYRLLANGDSANASLRVCWGAATCDATSPQQLTCTVPASLTATDGASVGIPASCGGGSPPYLYRWQYNPNGTADAGFTDLSDSGAISNSAAAQMQIAPVHGTNAGWYRVRANDSAVPSVRFTTAATRLDVASPVKMGEIGAALATSRPTVVHFTSTFAAPPVVLAQPHSAAQADVSVLRISAVTTTGFTVQIQDAPNLTPAHPGETFDFLAVLPGHWSAPNGPEIEVGRLNLTAKIGRRVAHPASITIGHGTFDAAHPPILFAQAQTYNQSAAPLARIAALPGNQFTLALQAWGNAAPSNAGEVVGWVAFGGSSGSWDGHGFAAGSTVASGNWTPIVFGGARTANRFIAALASCCSVPDIITLRRRNVTANGAEILLQKDTSSTTAGAPSESVSWLTVDGTGPLNAVPLKRDSCDAPSVTTQPVGGSVAVGQAFSLTSAATGSTPLQLQWFKDGQAITGATGITYSVTAAATSDAGGYQLLAQNVCGTAGSDSALLSVRSAAQKPYTGTPASLPGLLQAENVDLGGQAVAYSDLSPGNLGDVYRTDDVDVLAFGSDLALGAFDPGEWFDYTATAPAGNYDIDVRYASLVSGSHDITVGPYGATPAHGDLEDTGAWSSFQVVTLPTVSWPAIASAPMHLTSGVGALNIDWLRVRPAEPRASVVLSDGFSDVTAGQSLNGRGLPDADPAAWNVNADVRGGTTRNVTGTTGGNPQMTVAYDQIARGNKVAAIEAQLNPAGANWLAVGFTQAPSQGWIGAGQLWAYIKPSGRFAIFANGTGVTVATEQPISSAAAFRGAEYNQVRLVYDPTAARVELWINGVRVSGPLALPAGFTPTVNYAGWAGLGVTQDSSLVDSVVLSERDPPACASPLVTTDPIGRTVGVGATGVSVSASANGTAPLSVQWQKDGADIRDATATTYAIGSSKGIQTTDAGRYRARFSNSCGSATSAEAIIVVNAATRRAFLGTNAIVPGVVEGENVDLGTEGAAYHDVTPGNLGDTSYRSDDVDVLAAASGHVLGVFDATEWGEYSADVRADGSMSSGTPRFDDVPVAHPRRGAIETIATLGISAGCSATSYCPNDLLTRGQAAVFLIKASSPPGYTPPACTTPVFSDVPCTNSAAPYINEFYRRGFTSGCSANPLTFCINASITRAEMAVFLVRTALGAGYVPPSCSVAPYDDVSCTSFAVTFIADAVKRDFMEPCSATAFCADQQVTRGDMALMLTNAFALGAPTRLQADIRYSSGVAGMHTLQVGLDGSSATTNTLDATNDWNSYQTVTSAPFAGVAGTGSGLRLTTPSGGLNIDWLRVRAADAPLTWSVSDNFNTGTVGTALNARTLVGGGTWIAGAETTLGALGNVTATTASNPVAVVAYDPTAHANTIASVEAQLRAAGAEWLAVGFSKAPAQGWIGAGQVWALVKPTGRFAVFANGTQLALAAERDIPADALFRGNEYNQVRLIYDQALKRVELWINGRRVLAPTPIPTTFVPVISYAGWSGLNVTKDTSAVDGLVLAERAGNPCPLPLVAQEPASQTVFSGTAAAFQAVANGAVNSYQWQKDLIDIPGATSATLTIGNAQSTDAGSYRVRLNNTCGSVTSNLATLSVNPAPAQTPWTGTPFTIPGKVEAEYVDKGGEGISYHDTTPGNLGGALRSDDVDVLAVGSGYVLGVFDPSEWVEYTANAVSGGSFDVDIRYSAAPAGSRNLGIASNGQSGITAVLPSTGDWNTYHVFTAAALTLPTGANILRLTSSAAHNVDWLRIRPAQPNTTWRLRDDFEGATAGTTLSGRAVPNTALVWNGAGAFIESGGDVTSATASNPIGTITYTPGANKQAVIEAQLNANAAEWLAIGFASTPTQGWIGTGQLWAYVKASGRFSVLANGTTVAVVPEQAIPAAAEFRANEYNQVRLIYAAADRRVELWINGVQVLAPTAIPGTFVPNVQYAGWSGLNVTQGSSKMDAFMLGERDAPCIPAQITQSPANQTVAAGATVTFTSAAAGTGVSYQWQKNAVDIGGATAPTLSISNAQSSDAGSYRLRASNACGSDTSTAATLTVNSPPPQSPWTGTPLPVPGKIEAEFVDKGGEGVAYHDTTLGNAGGALRSDDVDVLAVGSDLVLGAFDPGEWVKYTTSVATAGNFDIDVRYSAFPGGTRNLGISSNGQAGISAVLPSTSDWNAYHVFTVQGLNLAAGNNVLKLTSSAPHNIDWLRIRPAQPIMTLRLRDDFEGATAGAPLAGRTLPGSTAVWTGTSAILEATTFDATGPTGSGPIGTLAYSPSANKQAIVEAQLNANGAEWLAVGFTQAPTQGWFGTGQLWAYVKASGRFAVFANGTAVTVAAEQAVPTAAQFRANEYNQVRLIYDPVNRRAEAWINGVQVLAPTLIPSGFVPSVQYAGWSGLNVTQGASKVDAFVVSER